jgi:hypothetical protein
MHPRLRADLLLAAALLHDLGRARELGPAPSFRQTDEGRLLGHVHLGLRLIEDRAAALEADVRAELLHAIAGASRPALGQDRRSGGALPRKPARRGRGHPARRTKALACDAAWKTSRLLPGRPSNPRWQ